MPWASASTATAISQVRCATPLPRHLVSAEARHWPRCAHAVQDSRHRFGMWLDQVELHLQYYQEFTVTLEEVQSRAWSGVQLSRDWAYCYQDLKSPDFQHSHDTEAKPPIADLGGCRCWARPCRPDCCCSTAGAACVAGSTCSWFWAWSPWRMRWWLRCALPQCGPLHSVHIASNERPCQYLPLVVGPKYA